MQLADLKDRHSGEDIWVLGSGATLNHVDPGFWAGKTVVVTNHIGDELGIYSPTVYTHSHYHSDVEPLCRKHPDNIFVTPEGDRGLPGSPAQRWPNVAFYPHRGSEFDFVPSWMDEGLIVGSTSLHGSMHLAAYMGAANIILAGADCGFIDGQSNFGPHGVSGDLTCNDPAMWLSRWNDHLCLVKAALMDAFDVSIMSLNPFVNLRLEGHTFSGSPSV